MSTQGPPSTTSTTVPDWLSNYASGLFGAAGNVAQMPYVPYQGPRVADLSPLQTQAMGGFSSAIPFISNAAGTLADAVTGDSGNPIIQSMTRGVTDQYNNAVAQTSGRFNTPGNWGSVRQGMADELNQRALATGLGDAQSQFRLGAANTLGSLLNTGLSGLNSTLNAGGVQQGNLQNVYNTAYNDFLEQRNYPWTQLQNAGNLLGLGRGASGSTTTSVQGYDPVSQGIGLYQLGSQLGGKSGGSSGGKSGSTSMVPASDAFAGTPYA